MRRAHILIAMLIATALGGCVSPGMQVYQQARRDCGDTGGGSASADCMKRHPSFGQFPAIAQRSVTYAAAVMEEKRAGKLTPAQADLLVSEYNAKLEGEVAAAEAVRQQNLNQALGETGATLLAIDAMNRSRAPAYTPPPRMMRTTNCNAMGGTLNCTTF